MEGFKYPGRRDRGDNGLHPYSFETLASAKKPATASAMGVMAACLDRGIALADGGDVHIGDLTAGPLVILIVAGAVAVFAVGLFLLGWVQSLRSARDSSESTGDTPGESEDRTEG